MDRNGIKLMAFDLDGTLTQHKSPLSDEHREVLNKLRQKYRLIMVGAGMCHRIFRQMREFPVDIIGNYGMQYAAYNAQSGRLEMKYDVAVACNRELCEKRVSYLRGKYGFGDFIGENIEYHSSGCITFPLLGTKAKLEDKLAFDPDRRKRRAIYQQVAALFPEYNVFVGGSSSFDMAPKPYDKYYALDRYCIENGLEHSEVVYLGDDYGMGGNDESVCNSDFSFIKVDNYTEFPRIVQEFLEV